MWHYEKIHNRKTGEVLEYNIRYDEFIGVFSVPTLGLAMRCVNYLNGGAGEPAGLLEKAIVDSILEVKKRQKEKPGNGVVL